MVRERFPAGARYRRRRQRRLRAREQHRHSRDRQASSCCCSIRTRRAAGRDRPAGRAAGRDARGRGHRPAHRGRAGRRRAVVRRRAHTMARAPAQGHRLARHAWAGRRPQGHCAGDVARAPTSTGSPAPACWCAAPIAEAAASSTSAISCTSRTWTSARRSARRAGRSSFSPVAEIVHLRGRSGLATSGAARLAWHAEPPGLLSQAPARLGAVAGAIPEGT